MESIASVLTDPLGNITLRSIRVVSSNGRLKPEQTFFYQIRIDHSRSRPLFVECFKSSFD